MVFDVEQNSGNVLVTGSGFEPGSTVALAQCPAAVGSVGVDAEDCLYDYGVAVVATELGEVMVQVSIDPIFQRSSGEYVDFVSGDVVCVIGDPWPDPGTTNRYVTVPIFDESVS